MASEKMLSPNTTIWWVPDSGIADPKNPTAAEINAGVNISCAIVTGYSLNPADSDTDDSRSICDNSNAQSPTFDNYEGDLTFFRDADAANAESVFNKAYGLFKNVGASGYLVRRIGKTADMPAAAGDYVSLFKFTSDYMRSLDGDEGGSPVKFQVKFIPAGMMNVNHKLA